MEEIWKPILNFEGLYEVSNLGRIRSLGNYTHKGTHIKKPTKTEKGYLKIQLYKDGKRFSFRVHRIVAEAFISNPNNLPEVNHKDENKLNNSVANLEWCDHVYNQRYGTRNQRISKTMKSRIC